MESWLAVPDVPLAAEGPTTATFLALGIVDLRKAARWLYELPYGRNSERSNWRLVPIERRGTCSTKHALLASLASEQRVPLLLTLGLYEMCEANTPGVGATLARYHLVALPEAHCYVRFEETRIDVTRAGILPAAPISFQYEESIEPDQIGEYKVEMHRRFLRSWVERHNPPHSLPWEEAWRVREACIAALGSRWDRDSHSGSGALAPFYNDRPILHSHFLAAKLDEARFAGQARDSGPVAVKWLA